MREKVSAEKGKGGARRPSERQDRLVRYVRVVVLPNDRLYCLCARHRRPFPQQRRSRTERESSDLPQRVQRRRSNIVLGDELVEHGDMLLLAVPHVL